MTIQMKTTAFGKVTVTTLRALAAQCGYSLVEGVGIGQRLAGSPRGGCTYGLMVAPKYLKLFKSARACAAYMEGVLTDWAELAA